MAQRYKSSDDELDALLAAPEPPNADEALDELLATEVDYDIGRSIENLGPSAKHYASDIADGLLGLSPVGFADSGALELRNPPTIDALRRAASGGLNIAAQNITGIRDDALALREQGVEPSQNEMLAEGIGEHYTDRYGDMNSIKTTLMEDPVAALADAAAILTLPLSVTATGARVAGLGKTSAALEKAARVSAGLDPATYVTHLPKVLDAATDGTRKLYQEGMRFSERAMNRFDAKRAAELGLNERVFPTEKGLIKSRELLNSENEVLAKVLDDTPDIELLKIYDPVADLETTLPSGRAGPRGSATPVSDARIITDTAEAHLDAVGPLYPENTIPATHANDIKRALQRASSDSYKVEGIVTPSADAQLAMARGAKEALEEANPALTAINQRIGARGLLAKTIEDKLNAPPDIRPRMDYPTRNLTGSAALSVLAGAAYAVMSRMGIWGRQLITNQPAWAVVRQTLVAEGKSEREADDWIADYNQQYRVIPEDPR